jgi:hypothetical protein
LQLPSKTLQGLQKKILQYANGCFLDDFDRHGPKKALSQPLLGQGSEGGGFNFF